MLRLNSDTEFNILVAFEINGGVRDKPVHIVVEFVITRKSHHGSKTDSNGKKDLSSSIHANLDPKSKLYQTISVLPRNTGFYSFPNIFQYQIILNHIDNEDSGFLLQ